MKRTSPGASELAICSEIVREIRDGQGDEESLQAELAGILTHSKYYRVRNLALEVFKPELAERVFLRTIESDE